MKKTVFTVCLVALLGAAPALAQVDFSNYVALGDSMTTGFASASMMNWYQDRSYPAILAQQAGGSDFEQPYISEPGIGPIFELVSLLQDGELRPVIAPVGLVPGLPTNAEYPGIYNNLGIPTATLYDMIFQTGDINNLILGNFDTVFFDIVLRNGINTALEQAIGMQPTFMTVWIGSNDVLPAVLAGTPIDGITMTPVDFFAGLYGNAIGALATTTTADIVLINVPYPTAIPFTESLDPYVDIQELGRWYLMADTGPLTDDDLLTLGGGALLAQGYGLPGGPPLPDNMNLVTGEPGVVLRAAEVELINAQVDGFNAAIAGTASAFGYPVFDVNALFASISSGEFVPTYGGATLSTQFLLGGIFSYDGIHPQHIGYALLADELIQFINAEYGSEIPRVDMAEVLFEGDWQSPGVSPAKARETVMSAEAFQRLYELFPPKLDQAPRIRRPSVDRPDLSGRDNRIRPATRP
jgi:lysophospholipase L1-like esterase